VSSDGLAERAFSDGALRRAWSQVLANDLHDGQMSAGVARFEESLDEKLVRLAADLTWGTYCPRDLTEIEVPKDTGTRLLHIPAVQDRIVERAILEVVTPYVDPHLGPASFAYRPGLGVADAIAAVVALREEGLGWVLRTDVDDCFPSLPVGLARRMLGALVDDADLLAVVDLLLARLAVSPGRGRRIPSGVPQGCALSPTLANLVLSQVDQRLMDKGFPVVRYADDMVVASVRTSARATRPPVASGSSNLSSGCSTWACRDHECACRRGA
jgi:retron-type reverse transcriptase